MTLIEKLKTHSSKWIKTKNSNYKNFYWQHGYGCFSINPGQIDSVKEYIRNQEIHHRKWTFQDEYRAFLKKYNVDFNEKFVWD